ncbi:MAG: DUF1850 domain-containing protein [Bacillota bacterium]
MLLLIIIIIIITLFLKPLYVLEVRVDGTEKLVYQQQAKLGDTFDVYWIHSVTLQPVIETYEIQGFDRISLKKMVFDDNGPNLPAYPEAGQEWKIENGKFIISGYDRIFTRVPVTIGAVISNHILIYKGKNIRLKESYRPGGFVHIGLARKSVLEFLLKEYEIWRKKN